MKKKPVASLFPTTDILLTAMQSGMDYVDAASEFADNTFGEAAGRAAELYIALVAGKAVMFIDQGAGVKDLNNMFTLGGSGSRGHGTDIGRFGVGSKFGALTFGHKVTVHTVRNGVYHSFCVDWDRVMIEGQWPEGYDGEGEDPSRAPEIIKHGGTAIVIENLKSSFRMKDFTETFKKSLGMRFIQQFADERDILLCKARNVNSALSGKFSSMDSLAAKTVSMLKEATSGQRTAELVVAKKHKARVSYAKLPSGDSALSGIHIAFGGRTIETVTNTLPGGRKVPSKLFAVIMLDKNDWKQSLNYNKTRITQNRDELLSEFEKVAKSLLDELDSAALDNKAVKLSLTLSNVFNEMFGDMLKTENPGNLEPQFGDIDNFKSEGEGEDLTVEDSFGDTDNPVEPGDVERPLAGLQSESKPGTTHKRGGAFRFEFDTDELGSGQSFYQGTLSGSGKSVSVSVTLNLENDMVAGCIREARNLEHALKTSALMSLAMSALADIMMQNEMFNVALDRELGSTKAKRTYGEVFTFLTSKMTEKVNSESDAV